MRLSDVLSMDHDTKDHEVEGFLGNTHIKSGKSRKIHVGHIGRNYYCPNCKANRTFTSVDELTCVVESDHLISIDAILSCPTCSENHPTNVEAWFLIGCRDTFFSQSPVVYTIQCNEKLSRGISYPKNRETSFDELLEKADRAYSNQLGAGAVIYLRKIFEQVTLQTACAINVPTRTKNDKRRTFREILKDVNDKHQIIPPEFSSNGYRLFGDISNVIHGDFNEAEALDKYKSFKRLICGILDNINNNKELLQAVSTLGWDDNDDIGSTKNSCQKSDQ